MTATVIRIMLGAVLLLAGNGYCLSGSICGKDLNNDGQITTNEFQQCLVIANNNLCPIDLIDCQMVKDAPGLSPRLQLPLPFEWFAIPVLRCFLWKYPDQAGQHEQLPE